VPRLYVDIWSGLWAPRATPKDVVAKLKTGRSWKRSAIRESVIDWQKTLEKTESRSGGQLRRQASRANKLITTPLVGPKRLMADRQSMSALPG